MANEEFRATNRVFEEEVVGRGDRVVEGPWGVAVAAQIDGGRMPSGVEGIRLQTLSLDVLGDRAQEIGRAELTVAGGQGPVALKYVVLWKREDGAWRWDVDIWNADS